MLDLFQRNNYYAPHAQRRVEQLAARRAHNPEVAGSSPAPARKFQAVLQGGFFYGQDSKGESGCDTGSRLRQEAGAGRTSGLEGSSMTLLTERRVLPLLTKQAVLRAAFFMGRTRRVSPAATRAAGSGREAGAGRTSGLEGSSTTLLTERRVLPIKI